MFQGVGLRKERRQKAKLAGVCAMGTQRGTVQPLYQPDFQHTIRYLWMQQNMAIGALLEKSRHPRAGVFPYYSQ